MIDQSLTTIAQSHGCGKETVSVYYDAAKAVTQFEVTCDHGQRGACVTDAAAKNAFAPLHLQVDAIERAVLKLHTVPGHPLWPFPNQINDLAEEAELKAAVVAGTNDEAIEALGKLLVKPVAFAVVGPHGQQINCLCQPADFLTELHAAKLNIWKATSHEAEKLIISAENAQRVFKGCEALRDIIKYTDPANLPGGFPAQLYGIMVTLTSGESQYAEINESAYSTGHTHELAFAGDETAHGT